MRHPGNSPPLVSIPHQSFLSQISLHGYISDVYFINVILCLPFLFFPSILPYRNVPEINHISHDNAVVNALAFSCVAANKPQFRQDVLTILGSNQTMTLTQVISPVNVKMTVSDNYYSIIENMSQSITQIP